MAELGNARALPLVESRLGRDVGRRRVALDEHDVSPALLQCEREGQAADAGADYQNPFCQAPPSKHTDAARGGSLVGTGAQGFPGWPGAVKDPAAT